MDNASVGSRDRAPFGIATAVGYGMSVLIVIYSFFNVIRAVVAPEAFSTAMGLASGIGNPFVEVYASRTAFIALVAGALLIGRQRQLLAWFAGLAILLPVADACLVWRMGASVGFIAKHLAIAAYLGTTAVLLGRGSQRVG